MIPGETALTRTGASSSARDRASDSSAPLAAPTIAEFGRGRMLGNPRPTSATRRGGISADSATRQAAPELAFHGGAHVFHRHGLERTGLELRRGQHDMVDRAATAKQVGDIIILGDIGRDRNDVSAWPLSHRGARHCGMQCMTSAPSRLASSVSPDLRRTSPNDDDLFTCELMRFPRFHFMET